MTDKAGRLSGHTALITGGSSGIGRSIAEAFVTEGAAVVVHGRGGEHLEETVRRCRELGGEVDGVAADLGADSLDLPRFVSDVRDRLPGLDVFVSCAGGNFDVPFLEMTAERFDRTWRLNVRAGSRRVLAVCCSSAPERRTLDTPENRPPDRDVARLP